MNSRAVFLVVALMACTCSRGPANRQLAVGPPPAACRVNDPGGTRGDPTYSLLPGMEVSLPFHTLTPVSQTTAGVVSTRTDSEGIVFRALAPGTNEIFLVGNGGCISVTFDIRASRSDFSPQHQPPLLP